MTSPSTSTCTTYPYSTTHSTAQIANKRHSWQNGTRCKDGVKVLWCHSHLVFDSALVFVQKLFCDWRYIVCWMYICSLYPRMVWSENMPTSEQEDTIKWVVVFDDTEEQEYIASEALIMCGDQRSDLRNRCYHIRRPDIITGNAQSTMLVKRSNLTSCHSHNVKHKKCLRL